MMKINDEYLCAVRTKSFADFFLQAQSLVNSPSPWYQAHCHPSFPALLLNPGQETIASLLKSSKKSPHLKSVLSNYFNISAEASSLCTNLLKTLIHLQNNYKSINQILDDPNGSCHEFQLTISNLLKNPFSVLNQQDFATAHDKHSSILRQLRSSRKKMAGKLKMIEFLGGALPVGPALLVRALKKRFRFFMCGYLVRGVVEQLDVAAKGAYILKRDFDTIGRLVARIGDEIEHDRAMVEVCLERGEDGHSLQVLKEMKNTEFGVSRQAEELEEHVYLCLVTINRARAMVVREICRNSSDDSV